MKVQFYVPLPGAPQGSKIGSIRTNKSTGKQHVIMRESSAKVKPYREAVKRCAIAAGLTPKYGPISLTVVFVRKAKANAPKSYTPFVTTLPDIDKQLRALFDGLTGVAYRDDGQVCHVSASELYPNENFPNVGTYIVVRAGKDVPEWLGQWPKGKQPDF